MAQNDTSASSTALRLTVLSLIVVGLLLALFTRLWFLQVLAGDRYAQLAERNRVRVVVTEAPRGRILGRSGEELVKNRPALTISADPQRLIDPAGNPRSPEAEATLQRLTDLLGMTQEEIVDKLTSRKYSPFRVVPIKEDVPPEVIFTVKEHQELYPGVTAETLPVRTYPLDTVGAHLVGYIGEITEEQLAKEQYRDYRLGDLIGKAGLEATYEEYLQGEHGRRMLEVNARGIVIDELERVDPVPGRDLRTSLDLDLQVEMERILREGIVASRQGTRDDGRQIKSVAGSAVVLDPRNGEVLAMASFPTYDPKLFVGGIRTPDWESFHAEANHYPLLNRAIYGAYPPGSTYKIISGAAGLAEGLITTSSTLPCPPAWNLGSATFRNWSSRNEGPMDLSTALKRSCDTFFYEVAFRQWAREERLRKAEEPFTEAIQTMSREFGLGQKLGIDLPTESAGIIPGREWKHDIWLTLRETYCAGAPEGSSAYLQRLYRENCVDGGTWRGGDAVNMSIGQGDVLATPLQIAAAYSAIANGGKLYRPHLGLEVLDRSGEVTERIEPEVLNNLPLDDDQIAEIHEGLYRVVMEERGTAVTPFNGFPLEEIPVAGKTGTAEAGAKVPYAWFASYAPADDPRYVVVVSVEEGSGGSVTAAPIARRILEAAFDLPVTPFQLGPATD